jgi:hypothetical protein
MKNILVLLALHTAVSATVIWTENFELYDTTILNLEDQALDGNGNPIWLTDPIATQSIAAIDSAPFALPSAFGDKVLAIGGLAPQGALFIPREVSVFSPAALNYTPAFGSEETELVLSMDMFFSAVDLNGLSPEITDSFRFSFFDKSDAALGSLLFTQGTNGFNVSVLRDNLVSTFDTQFTLGSNTAVTLDLVMNLEFGKWSGSITPVGTLASVPLFADVDMTDPSFNPQPARELGSFQVAWIGLDKPVLEQADPANPLDSGNYNWGSNTLVLDNISLTSQVPIPEPSSALLLGGFSVLALFRRSRRA